MGGEWRAELSRGIGGARLGELKMKVKIEPAPFHFNFHFLRESAILRAISYILRSPDETIAEAGLVREEICGLDPCIGIAAEACDIAARAIV